MAFLLTISMTVLSVRGFFDCVCVRCCCYPYRLGSTFFPVFMYASSVVNCEIIRLPQSVKVSELALGRTSSIRER